MKTRLKQKGLIAIIALVVILVFASVSFFIRSAFVIIETFLSLYTMTYYSMNSIKTKAAMRARLSGIGFCLSQQLLF